MSILRLTAGLVTSLALVAACTSTSNRASDDGLIEEWVPEPSVLTTPDDPFEEQVPAEDEEPEVEDEWDSFSFTVSDDDAQQPFTAEVTLRGTTCPASQTGVTEWAVDISGACITGNITVTTAPFPVQLTDICRLFPKFFYVAENAGNIENPIFAENWPPGCSGYEQVQEGDSIMLLLVGTSGTTRRLTSPDGPPTLGIGVWETEEYTVEDTSDVPTWRWPGSDKRTRYTRLGFIFLSGSTLDLEQANIAVCEKASRTTCTT